MGRLEVGIGVGFLGELHQRGSSRMLKQPRDCCCAGLASGEPKESINQSCLLDRCSREVRFPLTVFGLREQVSEFQVVGAARRRRKTIQRNELSHACICSAPRVGVEKASGDLVGIREPTFLMDDCSSPVWIR